MFSLQLTYRANLGGRRPAPRARFLVLLLLLAAIGLSGCVRRRMTIRSNPPGALVYVDDYEIGTTPVSHNFTYYGQRKIRLVKDGYETLTVMQSIPAPWYQIPPADFFAENVVPGEIRDQHTFTYQLRPQQMVPPEQLLGRAEQLRRGVQPVAATAPVAAPAWGPPATAPPAAYTPPSGYVPMQGNPTTAPALPNVGGQPTYPLPPGS